jgi:hypothetical protein
LRERAARRVGLLLLVPAIVCAVIAESLAVTSESRSRKRLVGRERLVTDAGYGGVSS